MNVILYLHPVYTLLELSRSNYSTTNLFQVCNALYLKPYICLCLIFSNP